jgi:hypothetical protein
MLPGFRCTTSTVFAALAVPVPSELQRSSPFVAVRVRETFARKPVHNDSAVPRSTPESTGAADDRVRHGEAVARRLEIRTAYGRGNAIARKLSARQRRQTRYVLGAAVPKQRDLLGARVQELCVSIPVISKLSRGGTVPSPAKSAGVCRGEPCSTVDN